MGPSTVLGAASAAVQFLDFTSKLLTKSITIYKTASELAGAHSDLQTINDDLIRYSKAVQLQEQPDPDDDEFQSLCHACHIVADELKIALEKLRKRNGSRWESFRLALRSIWTEKEIESLQCRVDGYRQQMSFQLLVNIQRQVDTVLVQSDQRADRQAEAIREHLLNKKVISLAEDIQSILRDQQQRNEPWQKNLVAAVETLKPGEFNGKIRKQLGFSEMEDRESVILEAYRETFEWIFHPHANSNWSNFSMWVISEEPIYWITGKADSGKSTLMKFIHNHPQLMRILATREGCEEVVILSFFFWNSGSALQTSQEGLLRRLLVQALAKEP